MITLILGGARSGKSAVAERLVAQTGLPATYVATMRVGEDLELAARVAEHRARRPSSWPTEEPGADLPEVLRKLEGTVLVDALGGWVVATENMEVDPTALCAALMERDGDSFVVSEEVGMGVHPATDKGRRFRDILGMLNQAVAEVADEVLFVVAGRVLHLDAPPKAESPGPR